MSLDIMQIGTNGLQSAQVGIATTGNNISNASTAGYSEEVSQQVQGPAQNYGFGFVGSGSQVQTVVRDYNQLLTSQINSTQSASSQITSYNSLVTPLDNLVADSSAGLSPVLQSYFSSLQNLAANPSSLASQQSALSNAQTLVSQFHSLQNQITQSASTVNQEISSEVTTINNYAQQLASVNKAIQVGYAVSGQQPPNALLDQRDQLVNQLSQETQVTVVPEGNQYNVFIGTGQPLVMGGTANTLTTVTSPTNPQYTDVAFQDNGTTQMINESNLPGGNLGGLFAFRTNSMEPIQNAIGRVAIVLGSAINAQNELGQTNSGAMGGPLFNIASPVVNTFANNTGTGVLSATITDPSALTPDNYSLTFDGANYTITDTTTNTVKSTFASFPATPTAGVNIIDGVTYNLSSGAMNAGDSFTIEPTANGAAGFGLATTDPTAIASAAPIATSTPTTNTGNATMSAGVVSTGFVPADASPATTLTYTAATGQLTGFPAASSVVATVNGVATTYAAGAPVPFTSGMSLSFNNMTFTITGTPGDGDTYTVGPNTNATGDNRNLLLMNALQNQNLIGNGTTTLQGAYAQMVDMVGNTTSQLNTTGQTETNLLTAATKQQQSVSGVNLDQETVNLMQYQQVYEACGKLIQVAGQNFSTVLALDGSGGAG